MTIPRMLAGTDRPPGPTIRHPWQPGGGRWLGARDSPGIRIPILIVALVSAVWALRWAEPFLIPLVLALFLTCTLAPVVTLLERWHVPRPVGAALTLTGTLVLALWGGYSLRDDARSLLDEVPAASRHLSLAITDALNEPGTALNRLKAVVSTNRRTEPVPVGAALVASGAIPDVPTAVVIGTKRVAAIAANAVVVLFLVFFLLSDGTRLQRKLARLIARRASSEGHGLRLLADIQGQLQRYVWVVIVTNTALGICTWLAFTALSVNYAGTWGVAAGVLHLVPYIGPATTAVAAGVAASMQFDSLANGLLVAAAALGISTLIGVVLTAWLTGRAAKMNMPSLFVSLLFWGWLWGLPGLLLGTPITMAVKVACTHIEPFAWISDLLGNGGEAETTATAEGDAHA